MCALAESSGSALVTGSARRVGRAIATRLHAAGWDVVTHARDASAASRAATEIGAAGSIGADLSCPEACVRAVEEAHDLLGQLDLIVCNASSFVHGIPGSITSDDWDMAINITARAPLLMMSAAYEMLERSPIGSIVLISDRSAREHWVDYAAHAAATAALESLCLSHANAWHGRVRVNAVQPGMIMPPDDWSDDRISAAEREAHKAALDSMLTRITRLASDQHTTGNIVVL